jgi:hypothetical protein
MSVSGSLGRVSRVTGVMFSGVRAIAGWTCGANGFSGAAESSDGVGDFRGMGALTTNV